MPTMTIAMTERGSLSNVFLSSDNWAISTVVAIRALSNGTHRLCLI